MSLFGGKKVLLGVTAGIAAYKSAWLVRLLVKAGAEVQVIMTPSAKEFVTPLTLSTLSKNPVFSSFTNEEDENAQWNNHVALGLWADFFIIAPATANTLSKMANGTSDNLLLATYLSAKCPVYYAPAMDLDMYKHPTTAATFQKLDSFGNIQIAATSGELASGLIGQGRMAEPEEIIAFIEKDIAQSLPLNGKKILITAGPTYEAIDPVRFIGNHSSGKMGYSIAEEASKMGAEVTLVSGPVSIELKNDSIKLISIISAEEMYRAVMNSFNDCDIAIFAAAVADYRPTEVASEKIKKRDATMHIQLEKTTDILAAVGKIKSNKYLVGFALETENEVENAKSKLQKKNLDLIVLNSLKDKGAGFKKDTNKITLIDKDNNSIPFEVKPKQEVARDILNFIIKQQYA